MDISTPAIELILAANIAPFLDPITIVEVVTCSTSFHLIFAPHIQNHLIFNIPRFAVRSQTQNFLSFYKDAKKICNTFLENIVVVPSGVTHYFGLYDEIMNVNFPLSITHLSMKTKQITKVFSKFPPNLTHFSYEILPDDVDPEIYLDPCLIELPPSLKVFIIKSKLSVEILDFPSSLLYVSCFFDGTAHDTHLTFQWENLSLLKHLNISGLDNWLTNADNLPPNLNNLSLTGFHGSVDHLPHNMKKFRFCGHNTPKMNNLPLLTHLTISASWLNHSLDFLPSSLLYLNVAIQVEINQTLDNLPENLKILNIEEFLGSVDHLPPFLEVLEFTKKYTVLSAFNSPVDNLPPCIVHITFSGCFNQRVDYLPQSVKTICFGLEFDMPVDYLPDSVSKLIFGYNFNQPVDHLPTHLISLEFGHDFNQDIYYLPPFLTNLDFPAWPNFSKTIENLPNSLKSISFNLSFDDPVDHLPPSLTKITFGSCFNRSVDNLPESVRSLDFSSSFNQPIDHLPQKLNKLSICGSFNQKIDNLPKFLRNFSIFSSQFDQPIDHLPPFLRKLTIRLIKMTHSKSYLPPSLIYLYTSVDISCLDSLPNLVEYQFVPEEEGEEEEYQ